MCAAMLDHMAYRPSFFLVFSALPGLGPIKKIPITHFFVVKRFSLPLTT